MTPSALEGVTIQGNPEVYEAQNVHIIYDEIASHFSATRYKPWPIIAKFLGSLQTGWIGLDSGTGNGKYLPLPLDRPGDIWTIGLDRSKNLLGIARKTGDTGVVREVVVGNVLNNPWREKIFDYAISIATIHHLATHERRRLAVRVRAHPSKKRQCSSDLQRLFECVSPSHGRILIYVWAIEQDELSKRKVIEEQDPIPITGKDVVVPWVLSKQLSNSSKSPHRDEKSQVFNRYYHMFANGELVRIVREAAAELQLQVGSKNEATNQDTKGVEIVQDGWERSNYYVELKLWQT